MPLTGDLKKDIAIIYTGVFGRAPEKQGLNYWYQQAVQNGWDLKDLAENMYNAAVNYPGYETLQNKKELIKALYENILGKTETDDPEGINYWTNLLQNGDRTPGQVISDIVYAALTQYPDHPATKTLLNRADASLLISEKFEDADIDGDGKVEDTDFEVFKKLVKVIKDKPEDIQKIQLHLDEIAQDPSKIDIIFSKELQDDTENNQQGSGITIPSIEEKLLIHVFQNGSSADYREDIYLLTSDEANLCINDSDVYSIPEQSVDLSGLINGTESMNSFLSKEINNFTNNILTYLPYDYIVKTYQDGEYYALIDIKTEPPYTLQYQVEYLKDSQKGGQCENSEFFRKVSTVDFNISSGYMQVVYEDKSFINQYMQEKYGLGLEDISQEMVETSSIYSYDDVLL